MAKKKVKSIDDILIRFKERKETFERMAEALTKLSTEAQGEKKVKAKKNKNRKPTLKSIIHEKD